MDSEGQRRRGGARFALLALTLCAMAARLPGLSGDLNDRDSWRQTDTASIAHNFIAEPNILYPRVFWGAPGPGYVEAEFQLYPHAVSLLYRLFGEKPIQGRLLSILLNGVACLVFFDIARRFVGDAYALLAVALFALAPVVYVYSRAFMPESTALLFSLLALKFFLDFLERESWRNILCSAAFMALAILVKPTTIHLGLVFVLLATLKNGWRSVFRPKLLAFGAIALLPSVAYYTHAALIRLKYGNTFGILSGGDSKWGSLSLWLRPQFYLALLSMDAHWILGAAGAVLALLGFLLCRETGWRPLVWPWAAAIAIYYFAAGRYTAFPERGLQYHLYTAPFLALSAAAGAAWLIGKKRRSLNLLCAVLLVLAFAEQIRRDWISTRERHPTLLAAGRKLAELSTPQEYVLVLSHDAAMDDGVMNNYQQPDVFFHAKRWGRCLARDQQTPRGLRAALEFKPDWYVDFDDANKDAAPGFREEIEKRMALAARGEGFAIYLIHAENRS